MTVGVGGWGSRRKPMALVRALCRGPARDLTVVSYGGPDVGLLIAAGKVKRLIYGFVSLDSIPLEPWFRAAREAGTIEAVEWDEGMLQWGLRAAAYRLPFLPARAGLGSDVMTWDPTLKTVRSPYADGEELVAVPALPLDVALVHVNRADARGNAQILGPDPYFDDLFLMAAKRRIVSCERVEDHVEGTISRMWVDVVVEAPGGARFTSCEPDYGRDEEAQKEYVAAARRGS
jgi:acyl CoA:acetate/3-ketoacid CoA transferase alpha subunit